MIWYSTFKIIWWYFVFQDQGMIGAEIVSGRAAVHFKRLTTYVKHKMRITRHGMFLLDTQLQRMQMQVMALKPAHVTCWARTSCHRFVEHARTVSFGNPLGQEKSIEVYADEHSDWSQFVELFNHQNWPTQPQLKQRVLSERSLQYLSKAYVGSTRMYVCFVLCCAVLFCFVCLLPRQQNYRYTVQHTVP